MFDGNKLCRDIADLLTMEKDKSDGLLYGNVGIVLFLYVYSHKTAKKAGNKYEKRADSVLGDILDSQNDKSSPTFENGLAGIGLLIEYLIQHGYCMGNADDILEDFDTRIYKELAFSKDIIMDMRIGLVGYMLYIINRLKFPKDNNSICTQINRELLIETINRIDMIAPNTFAMTGKDISFDLLWQFPTLLLSLNEAYKLDIHNEKIKNVLNQWTFYFSTVIPSIHTHRLSLAVALHMAYKNSDSDKIRKHICLLLYSIDPDIIESELDPRLCNSIQYGWVGVSLILTACIEIFDKTYPNYETLKMLKSRLIRKYADKLSDEFDKYLSNKEKNRQNALGLLMDGQV